MSNTVKEEYWVVAAGRSGGPVFLDAKGELTTKVHLAQHLGTSADAERTLAATRAIPGNLDWRVFHARSETLLQAF